MPDDFAAMFAFAANISSDALLRRCPDAVPIGPAHLPGFQLRFHGVATISPSNPDHIYADRTEGFLWAVSSRCLDSLDHFEGYPGLYRREVVTTITATGSEAPAFAYRLAEPTEPLFGPSDFYLAGIERGYREHDLDERYLRQAVSVARAAEVHRNGGSLVEIARAAGILVRTDKAGQTSFNIRPGS